MRTAQSAESQVPARPYSPAVIHDVWVHLAGHVPVDRDGRTSGTSAGEQARVVLQNIRHTLSAAEADMGNVVSTTVYLTDIHDIDAIDAAYREAFAEPYPARTTVQIAALGRPEFLVEISAVAMLPTSP